MSDISAYDASSPVDEFHPLVTDNDQPGFWGWIDRVSDRTARYVNPILIKESRQALKSKQFTITFFSLLIASWLWMVTGVVSIAPDVYYVPSGDYMMAGYYLLLAIPMMAMVPLSAHRSLGGELDEGTFEMLAITELSAMRIVTGKLGSSILQMLIYFAALVPCFAFCYILRGIDLPMIIASLLLVFSVAILLTAMGLFLGTVIQNRAGQVITLLALLAAIVFAEFMCYMFLSQVIWRRQIVWEFDAILFTGLFGLVGVSFIFLFTQAAASRIAPVTENRSTRLRNIMFIQQLIWIAAITTVSLWYDEEEAILVGIMLLGMYWLVMGTLMLGESPEMSPRVLRSLPRTFFGRMLLLWFNPGPGTGFMFTIATAMGGLIAFSAASIALGHEEVMIFATLMFGYLCLYLGAGRLIAIPICRAYGANFVAPLVTVGLLGMLGILLPSVFMVATTGTVSRSYGPHEFTNWIWTIERVVDGHKDAATSAFLALTVGTGFLLVNLFSLFREFSYRRVAVPARVVEDEQAAL